MTQEEKNPWAEALGKEAKAFLREHLKPEVLQQELADALGMKRHALSEVINGTAIITDIRIYALLYALGIKSANPYTIPPKRQFSPPRREYYNLPRAWDDTKLGRMETYLNSAHTQRLLSQARELLRDRSPDSPTDDADRMGGHIPQLPDPAPTHPVETTPPLAFRATHSASQLPAANTPPPEAVTFNFEAFMAGVGRTIDGGIAAMQRIQRMEAQLTQLTIAVAQLNTLIIQSQQSNGGGGSISELEGLVGEVLDTIKELKARNTTPTLPASPPEEQDISRILEMLLAKLRPLASVRQKTREDRDQFVRANKDALGELVTIIIPLSNPSERREESLRLAEEHKL